MRDKTKRALRRLNGEAFVKDLKIKGLEVSLKRAVDLLQLQRAQFLDELHNCALDDDLVWEFLFVRGVAQRITEELEQNKAEGSVPEARVPGTDLCDLCPNPETKDLCGDCSFNGLDELCHHPDSAPPETKLIRENYVEDMGSRQRDFPGHMASTPEPEPSPAEPSPLCKNCGFGEKHDLHTFGSCKEYQPSASPVEICKDLPINEDLPRPEDELPFDDMSGAPEGLV